MTDVVITAARRTPVGSFLGAFASTPAHELGRIAIEAALADAEVSGEEVSEVILGQVLTAGQGQNPARQAAMAADPEGSTVLEPQPGLRLGSSRGRARQPGDCARRQPDRRRRRAGKHVDVAALPGTPPGCEDGRRQPDRHDDQGRPD